MVQNRINSFLGMFYIGKMSLSSQRSDRLYANASCPYMILIHLIEYLDSLIWCSRQIACILLYPILSRLFLEVLLNA
jgi:hypothetical protein